MIAAADSLTPGQEQAVAALIASPTIAAAAKAAGIGEATLYRWLKEDAFQAAYREARRQTVSQAITQVQAAATEAVQTLRGVMTDPLAPAPSRVSAARTVLEVALRAVELEDLTARIERLEQKNAEPVPSPAPD